MQMTNIGTAYSIRSTGARILCLAISVYAAAMFGYLTALFATVFIDRDAKDPKVESARQKPLQDLQEEVGRLRHAIEEFVNRAPSESYAGRDTAVIEENERPGPAEPIPVDSPPDHLP